MKYWKCTVCGYVHEGNNPPIKCPVCGADRSKFVQATKKDKKEYEKRQQGSKKSSRKFTFIETLMQKLHAHPVSVHIPNGVLPMVVLFLILGYLFKRESLITAAFYGLIYVTVAMPVVIYTGFFDWKTNFDKTLNKYFLGKMLSGFIVFFMGLILIIWKFINPDVSKFTSTNFDVFMILHVIMLLFALIAGFLGGRLVFENRRE